MKHVLHEMVPVPHYSCDICAAMARNREVCGGCGIDLCDRCKIVVTVDQFTGQSLGDEPEHLCRQCHDEVSLVI